MSANSINGKRLWFMYVLLDAKDTIVNTRDATQDAVIIKYQEEREREKTHCNCKPQYNLERALDPATRDRSPSYVELIYIASLW